MYIYRFKGLNAVWPGIPCRDLTDQEFAEVAAVRKNAESFYQHEPDVGVSQPETPECIPCQVKKKGKKATPPQPVVEEQGVVTETEEVIPEEVTE